MPDDPEEKLYFVIISLDVSNISELRKITQLEIEGKIDKDGLKEFVKAHTLSNHYLHVADIY